MHLCFDVDDTITYAPEFFAKICECFSEAKISIVTFRADYQPTADYLASVPIRFDQLIVSTDDVNGQRSGELLHQWKARLVNEMKPDMFFEDMPEVVSLIDPSIIVLMPCDEVIRDWMRGVLPDQSSP